MLTIRIALSLVFGSLLFAANIGEAHAYVDPCQALKVGCSSSSAPAPTPAPAPAPTPTPAPAPAPATQWGSSGGGRRLPRVPDAPAVVPVPAVIEIPPAVSPTPAEAPVKRVRPVRTAPPTRVETAAPLHSAAPKMPKTGMGIAGILLSVTAATGIAFRSSKSSSSSRA